MFCGEKASSMLSSVKPTPLYITIEHEGGFLQHEKNKYRDQAVQTGIPDTKTEDSGMHQAKTDDTPKLCINPEDVESDLKTAYTSNDKTAKMREAKTKLKERTKFKKAEETIELLKGRISVLINEKSIKDKQIKEMKNKIDELSSLNECTDPIVKDMMNQNANRKKFAPETVTFASTLMSISNKGYNYAASQLPLPSPHICREFRKEKQLLMSVNLKNIDNVSSTITKWKSKYSINPKEPIDACLSVDALFFKPDVTIKEGNIIEGMELSDIEKARLPKNTAKLFTDNPSLFSEFVVSNFKKVLKAAFVFQLQPYDIRFKVCVVYIKEDTSGKSCDDIVHNLFEIRETAKNHNINIKSFAFDGDTAYSTLHDKYYKSYINAAIKHGIIITRTNTVRAVSDFLHLIKRLRYRLLKNILHSGFILKSPSFNAKHIQAILSFLPPVIFNDKPFTKMHDKPPLVLFSPPNFIYLFKKREYSAAAFWFPISLSIIAMDMTGISKNARLFYLECTFWFLINFKVLLDGNSNKELLKQKKSFTDAHVRFYTDSLLQEFTNTTMCNIQLLKTHDRFSFDRNSSIPLEHKFGITRGKIKDAQTCSRFVASIAEVQSFENECNELKTDANIPGRKNSFGVFVSDDDPSGNYIDSEQYYPIEDYKPQDIALGMLALAGFNVDLDDEKMEAIFSFFSVLCSIIGENNKPKKKHTPSATSMSYTSITLGVDGGKRAKDMIKNQSPSILSIKSQVSKEKTLEEQNIDSLYNLFHKSLNRAPNKNDLLTIYKKIKSIDGFCQEISCKTRSKKDLINWFSINFKEYEVMINSFMQK